jgi:xylulokinase
VTRLLAGVDVGTSGVKVGIFDPAGRLIGLGRSSYQIETPQPGWAQCDPELWWQGFLSALHQACREGQVAPSLIGAVGLSVLFPTVVPLDAQARALHPALLYNDQRSLDQVRAIDERIPRQEYEAVTGNRLVPGTCAVTSMAWLRDEKPHAYAASRALGFVNTFMIARLTGEFTTDATHASVSGLVDVRDPWRWSERLCEKAGIDRERLPRIAGSAEVAGAVGRAAAEETGLRAGTSVVAGSGDVVASAVGAGARLGGAVTYIAGSTDCVAVPMAGPTDDAAWINCAYVIPSTWLAIGATTSSGVSAEWFTREFLGLGGSEGLMAMTELAASSPPGSNRLIYVPYLQGERTPVWDPLARGVLIGLTASTTRRDLARAVLEGTAFALRQVIERAGSVTQGAAVEIRAVGGGTKNALWNQIKADVLQRPLHVLEFQETGTLGAALLAGVGCGVFGSFEEAARVPGEIGGMRVVEPDPARAALYDELFELYSEVYPGTRAIMHGLGIQP